jgi:hypothetical protein
MKPLAIVPLLCALAHAADLPPPGPAPVVVTKPAPKRWKNHFLSYGSFGFNAYTYLPASGSAPETHLTPASRGIIFQQVGLGYFVHPLLRLQLTFIFGETVSGKPANTDTLSTFAIVPWLIFTTHGFFTGVGPQLAPVSYGSAGKFDAGIYTATGYALQLGHGLSLPMSVQLVLMLNQRTSFAVTPAVALAYRF